MVALNELANKLQEFIIEQQIDSHNVRQLNVTKYNNLKLKVAQLNYPNVIVCIGISEATYNLNDCTKTDGGLGQDEKYVRKWISKASVLEGLKNLYLELTDLVSLEDEVAEEKKDMEGKAGAPKVEMKRKRRGPIQQLLKNSSLQQFEYDESQDKNIKEQYENNMYNPQIPALEVYDEGQGLESFDSEFITLQEATSDDILTDDNENE